MPRMSYEEEFEYLSDIKDINLRYISEIKECFEESLLTGSSDLDFLNEYPKKDNFLMTGAVYKLQTAGLIIKNERNVRNESHFFDGINVADEAIEKIVFLVLMLRRIEMDPFGNFSTPAYEYIKGNGITIEAIITVLKREAFEWDCEILENLYSCYESDMVMAEKLEWLYMINGSYKAATFLLKLADLQLRLEQYRSAIDTLKKIENPSNEIRDLIVEIGVLLNG